MVWIRSIVFQIYLFASVGLFATFIFLCALFPLSVRFALARAWGKSMLAAGRFLCGLDYEIEGLEKIPDSPCVFMIKHTTVFETYAQLAFFPQQTWVLKRELMWIPIFGWGLAAMRPIAINRNSGRTAVTQVIEQGKDRLAKGISLSIFPEGTRVASGETKRYGVSGAAVAKAAGVSIIPVAHNAGDFWPRRGLRKRPGLIRICVGPPIDPSGRKPKETNLIVQEWVETKMAEISNGYKLASSDGAAPTSDSGPG
jgi:1-acyl-sn-glycerol-3-phosphate acyltransferase